MSAAVDLPPGGFEHEDHCGDVECAACSDLAPRVRTCNRGRHPMTPGNLGEGGRCRACKIEYNRVRRRGGTWDGPIVTRAFMARLRHPVTPERLRADRIAVGACPGCGWTRDAGPHRACPELPSPDGSGPAPSE